MPMSDGSGPAAPEPDEGGTVEILRGAGSAPLLLVCEHASHAIPAALGDLGLAAADRLSHAAWDPGALEVARELSARFDAPLVAGRFSRLVYDLNRPPDAPGAISPRSERIDVPGNAHLSVAQRTARVAAFHDPFHAALNAQIERMGAPAIVTIHSFTPVFHGRPRTTEIGILFDPRDDRLARAMLSSPERTFACEENVPYGPADGVLHTLQRHALPRGLLNAMVEIRNDLATARAGDVANAVASMIEHALAQSDAITRT